MGKATDRVPERRRDGGQPTWEIAHLFPAQGNWSVAEYLALDTNQLIEFDEGYLEFLPMPSVLHQRIVGLLYRLLFAFLEQRGDTCEVLTAPMPVAVSASTLREPDLVVTRRRVEANERQVAVEEVLAVFEVVSPANRRHDTETKRAEYAQAGIAEYWLIDPEAGSVEILTTPEANAYAQSHSYGPGEHASSHVLSGFRVAVDDLFEP